MKKLLFSLAFLAILGLLGYYASLPPTSPHTPLGPSISSTPITHNSKPVILGFLPYWNLNKVSTTTLTHVNDLAYFALELDSTGQLIMYDNQREQNPGWVGFKRFVADPKFSSYPRSLTILMTDNDAIISLLSSPRARTQAINTILELTKTYSFRGVNLDFEPSGEIAPSTRDNFTLFVKELDQTIAQKGDALTLSIDIYTTLVDKSRLWDLPRLSPHVTYFVIMGYDYHYAGSDTAGPVSPLRGAPTYFNHDLVTNLGEISRLAPSSQLVLALPFYGYRYRTATDEKYSLAIGRGVTAPLSEVIRLINIDPSRLRWDHNSLTPYLTYQENNKTYQVYFENDLSFGLKLDLITTSGYHGIGVWALGYEGDDTTIWKTIEDKLQ